MVEVPITPAVLRWAIDQSGLSRNDVSEQVDISPNVLRQWEKGDASPSLTEFRRLATVLRRQAAVFFLASPPSQTEAPVSLRHAPGIGRSTLNSVERRYLREISRTQQVLGWVLGEMRAKKVEIPQFTLSTKPEDAAQLLRERIGVPISAQVLWKDAYEAFRIWREALEGLGVFVFLFPLGKDSARGMSIWNDIAPAIAVNTAWNVTARIYTLFHELAHLVTRTDSACVGYTNAMSAAQDVSVERWCERFAAAFLIPKEQLRQFLLKELRWNGRRSCDLDEAGRVARRYKVSLRAAVLALIDVGAAERSLYAAVPSSSDEKTKGGGGRPRTRAEIDEDRFGSRTRATLLRAIREDLMTRADVMTYLDVGEESTLSSNAGE